MGAGCGSETEEVQGSSSQPELLKMPEVLSRVGEGQGADDAEVEIEADKPQVKVSTKALTSGRVEAEEGVPKELDELVACDSDKEKRMRELASEVGPVRTGKDGSEFREAVQKDDSLREWRELGEKNEGVLVEEWDTCA